MWCTIYCTHHKKMYEKRKQSTVERNRVELSRVAWRGEGRGGEGRGGEERSCSTDDWAHVVGRAAARRVLRADRLMAGTGSTLNGRAGLDSTRLDWSAMLCCAVRQTRPSIPFCSVLFCSYGTVRYGTILDCSVGRAAQ